MYLTDAATDKIVRANMDGSSLGDLVAGVRFFAIAVDPQGGKMYRADRLTGKMQRTKLLMSVVRTLWRWGTRFRVPNRVGHVQRM